MKEQKKQEVTVECLFLENFTFEDFKTFVSVISFIIELIKLYGIHRKKGRVDDLKEVEKAPKKTGENTKIFVEKVVIEKQVIIMSFNLKMDFDFHMADILEKLNKLLETIRDWPLDKQHKEIMNEKERLKNKGEELKNEALKKIVEEFLDKPLSDSELNILRNYMKTNFIKWIEKTKSIEVK